MRGSTLSAALLAVGAAAADSSPSCSKGLYMVVARGSTEDPGQGVTEALTSQIAAKIKDSTAVAVDYPATLTDYQSSESKGVAAMQKLLNDYHSACPSNKIAILGYSQGAQAAMDSVCGGLGSGGFVGDTPEASDVMDSVVAVAVFGDPTHIPNEPYDRGTSTTHGLFPRNDSSTCEKYTSKIVSYCDIGDVYCSSGSNVSAHHQYIQKYGTEIVDFVVSQYQKSASSSNSNSTTGSGSGSGSGSNATVTTGSPTASGTGSGSGSSRTGSPSGIPTTSRSGATALAPATNSLIFGAGLFAVLSAMSHML